MLASPVVFFGPFFFLAVPVQMAEGSATAVVSNRSAYFGEVVESRGGTSWEFFGSRAELSFSDFEFGELS